MKQIKDYLQTQALKLNHDEIAVARAATQTVLAQGRAHIDNAIVQHDGLPEHISNQIDTLKQLFMALDSIYSRQKEIQTATIYAQPENGNLIRVAQIGVPIETELSTHEDSAWQYLAARTAHSGWANIADNVEKWLQIGELRGEHNRRTVSQTSLPICGEDGIVYGVLHIESKVALSENALADWVGLALGVLPVLREWCPRERGEA
ncbi:hypothetical protein [Wielerella bovis]|uniref:hypothetical protein n=1 Tax=Wielerella bovis TaxID=2917790 RepID=UPI002019B3DE|nr:hypothetical protein [Wielerella bovis]MCG7656421.1 hypothetical protein [Wielerella bovis]MCG7658646.1 hypothetical protein [Wielerella bovis]